LIDEEAMRALPIVCDAFKEVDERYPNLERSRRRHEGLRRVFGLMVGDVIDTSRQLLQEAGAEDVAAIRALGRPVIRFSDALWSDLQQIRAFLFTNMYRAPQVMDKRAEVTAIVHDLFPLYLDQPQLLPGEWRRDVAGATGDKTALARIVCDYVSGMTDRFAIQEHARLVGGA
ncbi:MAG: deoxyguanosinetriphosphate triphosphohydrolase, partial [Pseudomonadota bacterium]